MDTEPYSTHSDQPASVDHADPPTAPDDTRPVRVKTRDTAQRPAPVPTRGTETVRFESPSIKTKDTYIQHQAMDVQSEEYRIATEEACTSSIQPLRQGKRKFVQKRGQAISTQPIKNLPEQTISVRQTKVPPGQMISVRQTKYPQAEDWINPSSAQELTLSTGINGQSHNALDCPAVDHSTADEPDDLSSQPLERGRKMFIRTRRKKTAGQVEDQYRAEHTGPIRQRDHVDILPRQSSAVLDQQRGQPADNVIRGGVPNSKQRTEAARSVAGAPSRSIHKKVKTTEHIAQETVKSAGYGANVSSQVKWSKFRQKVYQF